MKIFRTAMVALMITCPVAAGATELGHAPHQGILSALQTGSYKELSLREMEDTRGTANFAAVYVSGEGTATGDSVLVKTKANTRVVANPNRTVGVGRAKVKVVATGDDRSVTIDMVADALAQGEDSALTTTKTDVRIVENKNKIIGFGSAYAKAVAN